MLASCAEVAASKTTKEMVSLVVKDAEQMEQRLVETDKRMLEYLDVVVKGISDSLEGRKTKFGSKSAEPVDDVCKEMGREDRGTRLQEGAITLAEHHIRTSEQIEMEKMWKERMEKKDKVTTNKYVTGRTIE